jgi:arylformamidase
VLYDISPAVSPATPVFPGDTPFSREVLLDMRRGDHLTLSTVRTTVHVGAHTDAPSHFGADAPTVDRVELERYLGPCQVLRVDVRCGGLVTPELIGERVGEPRVLLATGTFPDPTRWNEDFAAIAPEAIDHLHGRGVRLVGIDTPSVDPAASKTLPAHKRCLELEVAILEGLVLEGVPEGRYELIALPLKLVGFDASPVRAVLRSLPSPSPAPGVKEQESGASTPTGARPA